MLRQRNQQLNQRLSHAELEMRAAQKREVQARLNYFWNITVNQVQAMNVEEVDKANQDDQQKVAEYCGPILRHWQEVEKNTIASVSYMSKQTDINQKMRGILVDWVIEVHMRLTMLPETLFLSVNLIDRYLEKTQIMRTKLQLVAVAALFIASKYEEIYAPKVDDFVLIADNTYTLEEIFEMERSILVTLEFNITTVSSYRFLQRFADIAKANDRLFHLAQYLIELTLLEQQMLEYPPSNIAASALYLATLILYQDMAHWTPLMV